MSIRNFALIGGIIMLALGCLALIPGLYSSPETLPALYVDQSYGNFLNFFPMNVLNKGTLILFGLAGISCYFVKEQSTRYSMVFSKTVFWFMGALAIIGLFPQTNTLADYWPMFGNVAWLHGVFAVFGGYFGYMSTRSDVHHNRSQHA